MNPFDAKPTWDLLGDTAIVLLRPAGCGPRWRLAYNEEAKNVGVDTDALGNGDETVVRVRFPRSMSRGDVIALLDEAKRLCGVADGAEFKFTEDNARVREAVDDWWNRINHGPLPRQPLTPN